ncbi:MAG: hypothetical protein U0836_20510 [Pirellulales bacterium]
MQVGFTWLADRFSHWIAVREGAGWRRLLESVEGEGEAPWPPSPALQELHVETRGDHSVVALLVGRAGPAHWSLSLELAEQSSGGSRLSYDLACRVGAAPGWLGSTYRLAQGVRAERAGEGLQLAWAGGCAELEFPHSQWQAHDGALVIERVDDPRRWPATVRWGFTLRAHRPNP